MGEAGNDLVFSRKVLDMITVANEFCLFIEENERYEPVQILAYLERVVPLLYLKGSLLPEVEVSDDTANERFVTEEQWETFFNELKRKFGKMDDFFSNETAGEQEIHTYSLADNVADLYQDLKDFLLLYERNTMAARENAIHSCKNLFESRWGYRAIRVMQAIHYTLYGRSPLNSLPGYLNN
jgi:hypothetical protein